MAINLNTKTYGEQFNAFVNFASKNRNLGNVARIGETKAGTHLLSKNGDPRTIVAKDWDGAGQVWRTDESRKINNDVRDLFLNRSFSRFDLCLHPAKTPFRGVPLHIALLCAEIPVECKRKFSV